MVVMKYVTALILAGTLAACGSTPPPVPSGVSCPDDSLNRMKDVPAKANPSSPEFSKAYAAGYYIGWGCDVSGMPLP